MRVLLGLYEAAERVVADAQAITLPVLQLVSGSDFVVHWEPRDQFFEHLSSRVKKRINLPGFFHDTLGEKGRELVIARIRNFIQARFADSVQLHTWRDARLFGCISLFLNITQCMSLDSRQNSRLLNRNE